MTIINSLTKLGSVSSGPLTKSSIQGSNLIGNSQLAGNQNALLNLNILANILGIIGIKIRADVL